MTTAAFFAGLRARSRSLRFRLVALVAAALVPALAFDGWLTIQAARSERTQIERNADDKTKEVMADIDHEIASAKAVLIALASSQFLQTQDFERFHRQMTEVARQLGVEIVLRDVPSGRQIVNTIVKWGEELPQVTTPQALVSMREALESGKPSVSNVFFGSVMNQSVITVGIPVARGGANAYYLLVAIPLDTFAAALSNAGLPGQWTVTLVDRGNTIIARSERHSEYVGTRVKFDFSDAGSAEGVNFGLSREGEDTRWTWRRSTTTGWIVSIGVPLTLLEAPQNGALVNYAVASGALLALSVALTYLLSGYLPRSVGVLGIDRTPTREEFRILFESAPNGVLVVDEKRRIVLTNEKIDQKFGYERGELTGHPVDTLFPERFRDTSKAAAGDALVRLKPATTGDRSFYALRKDGAEFPIEILANPVAPRAGHFEIVTIIDTTARVRAAARLSAAVSERDDLRRRLMQAQEDERLRLARDLHDTLVHSIVALLTQIRLIRHYLSTDPARLADSLATAEDAAASGLARAREAIERLRPPDPRPRAPLPAGHEQRQPLEPAERAGGLGQHRLPGRGVGDGGLVRAGQGGGERLDGGERGGVREHGHSA